MSILEEEPRQAIHPGFQPALKISKGLESIPVSHVDQIVEAEGIFTVDDVARVVVDLEICTAENAPSEIKSFRRKHGYANDAVAGIWMIMYCWFIDKNEPDFDFHTRVRKKFEEKFGAPYNIENLFLKALGGNNVDPEKANLSRTQEDDDLDRASMEEYERKNEASKATYVNSCVSEIGF